jgi:transposase
LHSDDGRGCFGGSGCPSLRPSHRYYVSTAGQRMNANMIFKWLRDPRYAPDPNVAEDLGDDAPCFLAVEIVDRPWNDEPASISDPVPVQNAIEIDIAGGHRLRIIGGYDPEALARLIRSLSV